MMVSIVFPETITSIDDLFFNCKNLTAVTIPDSVTSISSTFLEQCGKDLKIYCNEGSYAYHFAKANGISWKPIP